MNEDISPKTIYAKYIKRLLDIMISLGVIILFFWLYIILCILVKIKLGSPVIFHQERPGKNGEIFRLSKFRSMTDERDENGELLPDEVRLTSFGRFLRKSSLDELPEFFNILRGDMSFVGPRPLLVKYLPYYNDTQRHRHDVRPGLTGLAQINGRNALQWEDRFNYDVEYVKSISFINDLKIVLKTFGKVFGASDVLSGGEMVTVDFDEYVRSKTGE